MSKFFIFLFVMACAAALGCKNNPDVVTLQSSMKDQVHQLDTANYTTIQWIDSVKDFGTVTKGEKVKVVFHFLNSGNKPLYLATVKPSCGCTLADYTKSAVLPGQQGEVTAEYDSNHGMANQPVRKTINVTCNAKNKTNSMLVFTGNVKAKA
jgi:hypothetical protein